MSPYHTETQTTGASVQEHNNDFENLMRNSMSLVWDTYFFTVPKWSYLELISVIFRHEIHGIRLNPKMCTGNVSIIRISSSFHSFMMNMNKKLRTKFNAPYLHLIQGTWNEKQKLLKISKTQTLLTRKIILNAFLKLKLIDYPSGKKNYLTDCKFYGL